MRGGPFATGLAFNAARRELADTVIRPAINRGDVVICDRYFPSTEIFQIAMGVGMSVEEEAFLRVLHRSLPQPDLLIFVLPSKELWMARMSQAADVDAFEGNAGELDAYESYAAKAAARGPVVILRPTHSMESMTTDSIMGLIDQVG